MKSDHTSNSDYTHAIPGKQRQEMFFEVILSKNSPIFNAYRILFTPEEQQRCSKFIMTFPAYTDHENRESLWRDLRQNLHGLRRLGQPTQEDWEALWNGYQQKDKSSFNLPMSQSTGDVHTTTGKSSNPTHP
jgi:hypothetical protein